MGLEQIGEGRHTLWQLLVNLWDYLPWDMTELSRPCKVRSW